MAVMASQPEGVSFEQKTQPVPSSDKMALDLDINGTSNQAETNLDLASTDPSLNNTLDPSSPSNEFFSTTPEVNGNAALNTGAFSSNNAIDAPPYTPPTVVEAQTVGETSSLEDFSSSQLPDMNTTVDSHPTTVSSETHLFDPTSHVLPPTNSVEAAVKDTFNASTAPTVIQAQESDLTKTSSPLASAQASALAAQQQPNSDLSSSTKLSLRQVDEVIDTVGRVDVTNLQDQSSSFELSQPLRNPENPSNSLQATLHDSPMALVDSEMADAPLPPSSSKVSREREDDNEYEPSAKRTKTSDEGTMELDTIDSHLSPGDTGSQGAPPTLNAAATPKQNGAPATAKSDDGPITQTQGKEIIKVLRNVLRTTAGKNFKAPVSQLWPTFAEAYAAKVPNEIDLGTIEKKVKEDAYSSYDEFKADVLLLYNNAKLFNGVEHSITKAALEVRESILSKTANLPRDVPAGPKPAKKAKRPTPVAEPPPRAAPAPRRGSRSVGTAATPVTAPPAIAPKAETFALDPSGNPVIRRDSTKVEGGRPKREIHPPKNKDLPYTTVRPKSKKFANELKFCEEVLSELKKAKHGTFSSPFLIPVDPVALGIPNYFAIIKNPMDISTVSSKLSSGAYARAKDFESDVRLIFSNCYKFNPPGNPVRQMGQSLEDLFNSQWERKAQWLSDHTPAALSPSSTADTEDEESEDEPEPVQTALPTGTTPAALRLIEEQKKLIDLMQAKNPDQSLIQMQQELVQIINKKVKEESQPPPKKATKKAKATTSKPVKKSAPVKKEKAGTTGSKKAAGRQKYLGALEKEVISNGLTAIPEDQGDIILKLIKSDQPTVEIGDDGTLELDIDMLSSPTLWKIYDIIMKFAPEVERELLKEREKKQNPPALAQPPPKKKNKPMSKSEQERKIEQLKNSVQEFERHTSGSQEPVMQTVEKRDDSSGDEDSDSEEE